MSDKKKFERPADISALTDADEIATLAVAARAHADEINAIDGDLTPEQMDDLEDALNAESEILARGVEVESEATALAERREALRERASAKPTEVEAPADEVVEEVVVEEPAEAELVTASGTRKSTAAAAASKAPKVTKVAPAAPKAPLTVMTASANVPDFTAGTVLEGMTDLASAFLGRVASFGGSNDPKMKAGVYAMSPNHVKHQVAKIQRQEREFSVDREMGLETQMKIIMDASNEKNLSGGSVIAAGGWCAPSETMYELFSYHTSEGTLDIPEVTARRGGINFTKGPDFMTVFGDVDAGFIQTETQAESGTFVKPCYALECPPFTEVRLDAIGFCATSPLLTEAAYPELVAQVLDMLGTGHARRKSQSTIQRIIANIPTVINWAEISGNVHSATADIFAGLELQANRIRQSLAMSPTATIEGFAPYWVRGALRNELSRRLGLTDPFRITDADVDGWLSLRGISLQYVYDYQMLSTAALGTAAGTNTWTGWPTKVEFTLYPAGAYTRLVNDVINLSAVYDHDLLTQNEYTAAFVEEGIAVANTRGFGIRIEFALNYNGFTGASAIGGGVGVTFAA